MRACQQEQLRRRREVDKSVEMAAMVSTAAEITETGDHKLFYAASERIQSFTLIIDTKVY